jgi:hypothetical protein
MAVETHAANVPDVEPTPSTCASGSTPLRPPRMRRETLPMFDAERLGGLSVTVEVPSAIWFGAVLVPLWVLGEESAGGPG